jgi:hypothetical protein
VLTTAIPAPDEVLDRLRADDPIMDLHRVTL